MRGRGEGRTAGDEESKKGATDRAASFQSTRNWMRMEGIVWMLLTTHSTEMFSRLLRSSIVFSSLAQEKTAGTKCLSLTADVPTDSPSFS